MYVSLFTVAIAVNYAGEFRQVFQVATYFVARQQCKSKPIVAFPW